MTAGRQECSAPRWEQALARSALLLGRMECAGFSGSRIQVVCGSASMSSSPSAHRDQNYREVLERLANIETNLTDARTGGRGRGGSLAMRKRASAIHTLMYQRHPTSCVPYRGENPGPGKDVRRRA